MAVLLEEQEKLKNCEGCIAPSDTTFTKFYFILEDLHTQKHNFYNLYFYF